MDYFVGMLTEDTESQIQLQYSKSKNISKMLFWNTHYVEYRAHFIMSCEMH